jgi:hypothetical protein
MSEAMNSNLKISNDIDADLFGGSNTPKLQRELIDANKEYMYALTDGYIRAIDAMIQYLNGVDVDKAVKNKIMLVLTSLVFDEDDSDDEDLEEGLRREIGEEIPGARLRSIGEQVGAYRVHQDVADDVSLVLIFFLVDAQIDDEVVLSEEHGEWRWVGKDDELPEPLDINMAKIVDKYRQ